MSDNPLPSCHKLSCGAADPGRLEHCFDHPPSAAWQFDGYHDSNRLPTQNRELFQRRLAELAFWRTVACPELQHDWPDWINAVCPFADSNDSLAKLLPYARYAAMAVFPLAGKAGHPPCLARIYLIADKLPQDSRPRLDHADSILPNFSLLLALPHASTIRTLPGTSWQLAAALALQAISEQKLRIPLGCEWICTGQISLQNAVERVELGNKLQLAETSPRRWLLPAANRLDGPEAKLNATLEPERIAAVATLEDALTRVRQHGVLAESFDFPQDVDVLHVLLGNSLDPAVLVALLIYPAHLCLWHSKETFAQAKCLCDHLPACHNNISLRELSSDNLVQIEKSFRAALDENQSVRQLISITGGNRLMGFGAMLAARAAGVRLVYRDIDAPGDQLEVITFTEDPIRTPRNGKINGNNCPEPLRSQTQWDLLYHRNSPAKPARDSGNPTLPEQMASFWRQPTLPHP